MFKSIIVVTGATGNQGNSTANFILNSPTLSAKYTVRAVSRSIDSPKMLALKSLGAELAQADLNDRSTLPAALKGASYAFLVTTTQYQGNTREIETRQAKAFCEEAITQGVKYVIFSSMSHPFKISNGALKNVEHFDDKAEIEEYIRTLPLKASFFAPASFMQNFETHLVPRSNGDGTYSISGIAKPGSRVPYIDITDTGKWIGAILAEPEKYEGKFFAAAEGFYTLEQAAEIISRVTGKTVTYKQLPDEVFKGFLRPGLKDALYEMWVFIRDYGYYGAEQEDLVQWAKKQAIGNLTSLEEFLVRENYTIE